jgi:Spy/CpxP family protein refolding chaperone
MKLKSLVVACVLLLAAAAVLAQQGPPSRPPDVPFMGNWNPPAALSTDWWNDPEIATELRLTDAQKKQLEQVTTNFKLTLIDAGATGLKSYVRLQSMLDTDPFDRNAYNQELDAASSAVSRLVKDLGQMALSIRTTLTAEQWHKLEAMRAAGRMRPHPRPGMNPDRRPRSDPPSSLRTPPQ